VRVLVLGASGMLGSAIVRALSESEGCEVFGTIRSGAAKKFFAPKIAERLVVGCDVLNEDALNHVFAEIRPDVLINCISLAKPLLNSGDPLLMIPIYSLLPHRLARLCDISGTRMVHISTDGVFSGAKGGYTEDDPFDAKDLYGISKYLGEVRSPRTIALRTSIIGHELQGANGLVDWFLSQTESCKGYTRVLYSGLPAVVLARIIRDFVLPRPDLSGIYHVAARPITKYALLQLVAQVYGKTINLIEDDSITSDRSLSCRHFERATGFVVPEWPELIDAMHADWERANRVTFRT